MFFQEIFPVPLFSKEKYVTVLIVRDKQALSLNEAFLYKIDAGSVYFIDYLFIKCYIISRRINGDYPELILQ